MSSGIYMMSFPDSSFYIGKSVDIAKRWGQHEKALIKGTHTKNIQAVYDDCGMPTFSIVYECHPDHIDLLETYFINLFWNDRILNTTRPKDITDFEKSVLESTPDEVWDISTFAHIHEWKKCQKEVEHLKTKLKNIKSGDLVEKLEDNVDTLHDEISRLRHRGFFARLFNK